MLKILVVAVLLAIAVGFAAGGTLRNLASVRLRVTGLLYLGLAIGISPLFGRFSLGLNTAAVAFGYAAVALFLGANIRGASTPLRATLGILILGWGLNALPVFLNHGMPLSLSAYRTAGLSQTPTPARGGFFKVIMATPRTRLGVLGDVIPIPPLRQVVSIGDIVLVVGLAATVAAGMRSKTSEPEGLPTESDAKPPADAPRIDGLG